MTDSEIIKAIEEEIQLAEYVDSSFADSVSLELLKNALSLINRQNTEIERLQATNVMPVKYGHWVELSSLPKSTMYICSVCNRIAFANDIPYGAAKYMEKRQCALKYCPSCGAKMGRENGEENGNNDYG